MKAVFKALALFFASALVLSCGTQLITPNGRDRAGSLHFTQETHLGDRDKNPSTPFLRHAPDGRLFAIWTEDHETPWPKGRPAGLDSYRGKPLVIHFFASWCDPCRDEMPLINELAAKAGANSHVLSIAVEDSRAAVGEYAKESKFVFPIALDLNSTVKRAYRIFGPPATFFVDGQEIIRDFVLGPITPERVKEAVTKVGIQR